MRTADRHVERHEASLLLPVKNKLDSVHHPPTPAEVTQKVRQLAPGLIRFLRGLEQGTQLLQELKAEFQASLSAT